MLADYTDTDGVDKHEAATYAAEDSLFLESNVAAVFIDALKKQGKSVHAVAVFWHGPKSAAEVLETAQTGPKPGWVCSVTFCDSGRQVFTMT